MTHTSALYSSEQKRGMGDLTQCKAQGSAGGGVSWIPSPQCCEMYTVSN